MCSSKVDSNNGGFEKFLWLAKKEPVYERSQVNAAAAIHSINNNIVCINNKINVCNQYKIVCNNANN